MAQRLDHPLGEIVLRVVEDGLGGLLLLCRSLLLGLKLCPGLAHLLRFGLDPLASLALVQQFAQWHPMVFRLSLRLLLGGRLFGCSLGRFGCKPSLWIAREFARRCRFIGQLANWLARLASLAGYVTAALDFDSWGRRCGVWCNGVVEELLVGDDDVATASSYQQRFRSAMVRPFTVT